MTSSLPRRYSTTELRGRRTITMIPASAASLCPIPMERETRFELATSTLARLHSTTELFPLIFSITALYNKINEQVSIITMQIEVSLRYPKTPAILFALSVPLSFVPCARLYTCPKSRYLLHQYGTNWRPAEYYADSFIQAFPLSLMNVEEKIYEKPEATLRRIYILRSLERFADFFGLVELKSVSDTPFKREYQVRSTGLLDALLQFGIGSAGQFSR
jgi:hypothetical protein